MYQTFITELKKKCEEIAMQEIDIEMAEKVVDAFDKVCRLNDTALKEGLISMEEEAGRMEKNCCSNRLLAYLLVLAANGYESEMLKASGLYQCVILNLPSYDGLINLIYVEGAGLIQCCTRPDVTRTYLKSLLPEKILEIAEKREKKG